MKDKHKGGIPRYSDTAESGVPSDVMEPSDSVRARLNRPPRRPRRSGFTGKDAGDAIAQSLSRSR